MSFAGGNHLNAKPLLIATLALAAGATHGNAEHLVPRDIRKPGAEPEVFQVEEHDARMREAVRQARRTLGTFIAALQHPGPQQRNFEVKKPFVQGGEVEHLWLSDVRFSGNRFHGRVDNRPRKIKGVKLGDLVSVNPDEISDWAFMDGDKLVGGYTIRAAFESLPPERRKELQNDVIFNIGKP
jgi:uncharacterized protein YegJ (DUF2314 family)